jgi:8-oxo-dGTP diphosphatase
MTDAQVFTVKPDDFVPAMEVAACYCLSDHLLLLVERHKDKPQGLTWAIPCGKLELDETPLQAVKREVMEEIGVELQNPRYLGCLYINNHEISYIYHMFEEEISTQIKLNTDEHHQYRWVSFEDAFCYPLIKGGSEALMHYREFRNS